MRFFLRSNRFKILSGIALLLVIVIILCAVFSSFAAPQSNLLSSILSPLQNAASSVSKSVGGFFGNIANNEQLQARIDELEQQIAERRYTDTEFENMQRQNEFYKQFLDIKEDNPSFKFCAAMVSTHDLQDPFGSFVINKGSLDGVSVYDPVITAEGIIGYISDTYSTQSVVMSVLNPSINISAVGNRTRDSGNITGDMSIANKGLCKMLYISKNNTLAAGDYVVTSGAGGMFPAGQIIGMIEEIKSEPAKDSCYATVRPIIDVYTVSDVMVITDFSGKS